MSVPLQPIVYDKGLKLQTADGEYSLVLKGRLQSRYSYDRESRDLGDGQTERVGDSDIAISRARLTLKGKVSALSYKFQSDFSDGFTLKDFFADYKVGSSAVRLRVGRFKRPSSRQHISSSAKLDLVDRSQTHKAFKNLRDTGFAVHNNYEKSPRFEWVVGVFSSSDPGTVSSEEEPAAVFGGAVNPSLVARIGYNHFTATEKPISRADLFDSASASEARWK